MIRRPPRSTLFPYTRSSDLLEDGSASEEYERVDGLIRNVDDTTIAVTAGSDPGTMSFLYDVESDSGNRSEEHTSELQSRLHLVCRLLLEKKKKKTTQRLQQP